MAHPIDDLLNTNDPFFTPSEVTSTRIQLKSGAISVIVTRCWSTVFWKRPTGDPVLRLSRYIVCTTCTCTPVRFALGVVCALTNAVRCVYRVCMLHNCVWMCIQGHRKWCPSQGGCVRNVASAYIPSSYLRNYLFAGG